MNPVLVWNEWEDSQKHEAAFWELQEKQGNTEQLSRNNWYRFYIFPQWFSTFDFRRKLCVDVGSGPKGILHAIDPMATKIAIDPLMDKFIEQGYAVDANGVVAIKGEAECIPIVAYGADVIFSLNMLDHVYDPLRCLTEIYRNLAFGGTLVLCVDMRPTELLDAYHKLQLTSEWLNDTLDFLGFKDGERFLKPHQKGNPTIQFCATVIK